MTAALPHPPPAAPKHAGKLFKESAAYLFLNQIFVLTGCLGASVLLIWRYCRRPKGTVRPRQLAGQLAAPLPASLRWSAFWPG